MTLMFSRKKKLNLLASVAVAAVITAGTPIAAAAQATETVIEFDIPEQSLARALRSYGVATDRQVMFAANIVRGKSASGIAGELTPTEALNLLLQDSGLIYEVTASGTILVKEPQREGRLAGRRFQVAQLENDDESRRRNAPRDDDETDERAPEEIVVTGTNIRGAAPVGAPLVQLDRDDIAQIGVTTIQELFEKLPQNFGGGISDDSNAAPNNGGDGVFSGTGGASVNLRGLGSGSTLVLLNGNRLAGADNGSFVDVSLIPLSAVERIEILTDGASAIYGTDAVAGVINIILRADFDGAETVARFGTVTDGGLRDYRASQTFGRAWGTGRALVTYDYSNRGELATNERSFSESKPDPSLLIGGQERHSVLGSLQQNLSGRIKLFATGLYSERGFSYQRSSSVGGTESRMSDNKQISLAGGLNIDLVRDWAADLSGGYSLTESSSSGDIPASEFIFSSETQADIFTLSAKASGPVFTTPGGVARVAIGGQYRNEAIDSEGRSTTGANPPQLFMNTGSRDIYAAFGEFLLPLVSENNELPFIKQFKLSAAARYENYSDFGSSFDPRLGVSYAPMDGVNLRGSWGTAFRAPTLQNLLDGGNAASAYADFLQFFPDPSSPSGFSNFIHLVGNATDELGAEESTNWTLGIDYEPVRFPNFQASLTYFNISYDKRIATPATGASFLAILSDPRFASVVIRNPDIGLVNEIYAQPEFRNLWNVAPEDIVAIADNRTRNIASTDLQGLDYEINYGFDAAGGQINLHSSGSYYLEFLDQITASAPAFDIVDTVFNPVDFTARNSVSWTKDNFRSLIAINYVDSYTDNLSAPNVKINSWVTVDLQLSYRFGVGTSLLRDTEFLVNVDNLLNEDPPLVLSGDPNILFDTANANPIGRFVSFQLSKRW